MSWISWKLSLRSCNILLGNQKKSQGVTSSETTALLLAAENFPLLLLFSKQPRQNSKKSNTCLSPPYNLKHVTYEKPNLPAISEIIRHCSWLMIFRPFCTCSSLRLVDRHSPLNIQQTFPHVWIEKSHSKFCVLPTSLSLKVLWTFPMQCCGTLYPQQSKPKGSNARLMPEKLTRLTRLTSDTKAPSGRKL